MKRFGFSILSTLATLALIPIGAVAQQKSLKEQLVGTWILVEALDVAADGSKTNSWGANPKGTYMFDTSGHFTQMLIRSDLPKIPNRAQGGTPEQNKFIVSGAIAMYGTYSVNDTEKTITVRFEGSTFSGFNGTEGKRIITSLSADEMKTTNPGTSIGMKAESVWRRAK
jgi:type II secretory pathway pseudopilin PulG